MNILGTIKIKVGKTKKGRKIKDMLGKVVQKMVQKKKGDTNKSRIAWKYVILLLQLIITAYFAVFNPLKQLCLSVLMGTQVFRV